MKMNLGNLEWHSAKARLKQERESFAGDPKMIPDKLTLAEIEEEPALFQPRFNTGSAASARHIEGLFKALGAGDDLGPVIVWWSGRRFILVDGHHRMAAYQRFSETLQGVRLGGVMKITTPVRCLTGSLEEAVTASLQGNSQDKLAMSLEEKMEGAWRMVCAGDDGRSKAEIAKVSGASVRTVANMREVKAALENGDGMKPKRIAGLSWEDARRIAKGDEGSIDWGDGGVFEARAQDMAVRISNAFKDSLTKAPEVAARALEIHSPALVKALVETWMGSVPGMTDHVKMVLQDQEPDDGFGASDGLQLSSDDF